MNTVRTLLKNHNRIFRFIDPSHTVLDAIRVLSEENVGALPVIKDGVLVGVFSERDYTRKITLEGLRSDSTMVESVMTKKVVTVSIERTAVQCLELMNEKKVRHLPVLDSSENVVGMLSILDVTNHLIHEQQTMINNFEDYVSQTWPF